MSVRLAAIDHGDYVANIVKVNEEHLSFGAGLFRDELDSGCLIPAGRCVYLSEAPFPEGLFASSLASYLRAQITRIRLGWAQFRMATDPSRSPSF